MYKMRTILFAIRLKDCRLDLVDEAFAEIEGKVTVGSTEQQTVVSWSRYESDFLKGLTLYLNNSAH